MSQSTKNAAYVGAVSESYARALFELSIAKQSDVATSDELQQVVAVVASHPELAALFAHQAIDTKKREATITRLFSNQVSPLVVNLLLVLNRKGRLDFLGAIAEAFERMSKQRRGEVDVQVYTARPLDSDALSHVASSISSSIGKKAIVQQHVDPALIGGLKIRIGDKLIDGSVASQLRRMARTMEQQGHDRVRANMSRLLQETT